MRVGGPARYFISPRTPKDVREAITFARENNLPFFVLGGGSNVVFPDEGFAGVIIRPEITGITYEDTDTRTRVIAGAGEEWDKLVEDTVTHNAYGLENLSLIPGRVGAAPVQNIGAYGTEACEYIEWVEAFDTTIGAFVTLAHDACAFGYRTSVFKENLGRFIITRVALLLSKTPNPRITYKDLAAYFADRDPSAITPRAVREAVVAIRRRKLPDVAQIGTCGSFFKNPVISNEQCNELKARFPNAPGFPAGDGHVKVPAAWLIEHAGGWKGYRAGNVGVYHNHALALVHFGGGVGEDIYELAQQIKDDIKHKTNITLEEEVTFVGNMNTKRGV